MAASIVGYVFRRAAEVQSGFDLFTEIRGYRLMYAMEGISGYPWFDMEKPGGSKGSEGLFGGEEEAVRYARSHPSLDGHTIKIIPVRTQCSWRPGMDGYQLAEERTAALPEPERKAIREYVLRGGASEKTAEMLVY